MKVRLLGPWVVCGVLLASPGMQRALAAEGSSPAPSKGEELAFDRSKGNCLSCHAIKGGDLPGTIGPALTNLKSRYPDKADLAALIFDETKRNPLTVMPPFGRNLILSKEEISEIVDFIYDQ